MADKTEVVATLSKTDLETVKKLELEISEYQQKYQRLQVETRNTELALRGLEVEKSALHSNLMQKYQVLQGDSVDFSTGEVTRPSNGVSVAPVSAQEQASA